MERMNNLKRRVMRIRCRQTIVSETKPVNSCSVGVIAKSQGKAVIEIFLDRPRHVKYLPPEICDQ